MSSLKETLKRKIEEHRPRTTRLLKDHSDVKLGEVTIGQAIGGARGAQRAYARRGEFDKLWNDCRHS